MTSAAFRNQYKHELADLVGISAMKLFNTHAAAPIKVCKVPLGAWAG